MNASPSHLFRSKGLFIVALLALVTAVAPWVRNHDYLRDFMDYGLVMAAAGRIDAGEAPYVDFLTPIQAGFLHLNRLIEKAGGGDYLGLTHGALGAIVLGGALLFWLFRRTLGQGGALLVAWAVSVCATAQHTILWHNPLGVLTTILACATAADLLANEKLGRGQAGRWFLFGLILCLSGLNKISFHMLAMTGTAGLVLRAVAIRQSTVGCAGVMVAVMAVCGAALPLAIELHLTGASWLQWRYNVIDLAARDRAEYLKFLLQPSFYLEPIHNYYGTLRFPYVGIAVLVILGAVLLAGWRSRAWLDRVMLCAAIVAAGSGVLAVLATNQDIAYVALGLGIGVAAILCHAFGIPLSRRLWVAKVGFALLLLPVLAAWESAWRGQRSQFGHAQEPRSEYVQLFPANPAFEYINGLHLPPGLAHSLALIGDHLPAADDCGRYPVFYAQSLEWLQRVWPAQAVPGLPLWMHNDTSYQESERQRLHSMLTPPSRFAAIFDSTRWDFWPPPLDVPINMFTSTRQLGSDVRLRIPSPALNRQSDDLFAINALGLNYLPELLHFDRGYFYSMSSGALFYGVPSGSAVMRFDGLANQLVVKVVLQRLSAPTSRELSARCFIEYDIDGVWHPLHEQVVTLAADAKESLVDIPFDGRQRRLRFTATAEDVADNGLIVGWFPPLMLHSLDDPGPPPKMYQNPRPERNVPEGFLAAVLTTDWKPDEVFLRGGTLEDGTWWLEDGAQVWFKSKDGLGAFDGEVTVTATSEGRLPTIRVVWFKGGRLQIMEQFAVPADTRRRSFHAWSSGPDGWFGVLVDAGFPSLPARLQITKTDPP